jgi:glycosyltransferase involved in cell wall biosynthesis
VLQPGDIAGLAAALKLLAEDDGYRDRLAAAARQRAENLPTWDDSARRFFGLLRQLAHADLR